MSKFYWYLPVPCCREHEAVWRLSYVWLWVYTNARTTGLERSLWFGGLQLSLLFLVLSCPVWAWLELLANHFGAIGQAEQVVFLASLTDCCLPMVWRVMQIVFFMSNEFWGALPTINLDHQHFSPGHCWSQPAGRFVSSFSSSLTNHIDWDARLHFSSGLFIPALFWVQIALLYSQLLFKWLLVFI